MIARLAPVLIFGTLIVSLIGIWSTAIFASVPTPVPVPVVTDHGVLLMQGQVKPPVEVSGWINIITSTGFSGLVWYLIAKGIPNMQTRFDESLQRSEATWQKRFDTSETHHEARQKRLEEQFQRTIERILDDKDSDQ